MKRKLALSILALLSACFIPLTSSAQGPGSLDTTFDAGEIPSRGDQWPEVINMALAADGKIYVSGHITSIGDVPRTGLARLVPNGVLDPTFGSPRSGGGESLWVDGHALLVQPDGKIWAGWTFLRRFTPDGLLDETNLPEGPGYIVAVAPDGTVLGLTDQNNAKLVRWLSDGRLDPEFDASDGPLLSVHGALPLAVQSDGRILVDGIRLNRNGTRDLTFTPSEVSGSISGYVLEPNGLIYVAGTFDTVNSVTRRNLARLHADGSVDLTFDSGDAVGSLSPAWLAAAKAPIAIQSDGKLVVATSTRSNLIRLTSDGSLDTTFDAGVGVSGTISRILIQPDDQVLICGGFTAINGIPRAGIARLNGTGKGVWLKSPSRLANGQFEFQINSVSNQTVIIEATAIFSPATWLPIWTNTLSNVPLLFTDTNAMDFPMRFYRAVLLP